LLQKNHFGISGGSALPFCGEWQRRTTIACRLLFLQMNIQEKLSRQPFAPDLCFSMLDFIPTEEGKS